MGASPPETGFRASPAERPTEAQAPLSSSAKSRWLAFIGAFAIHAAILGLLILQYEFEPPLTPAVREIPIEIVVETPQPKEPEKPAPKPDPPAPTRQVEEEPAHDAPRAANDEKIERKAPDDATKVAGDTSTAKDPSLNPAPAEKAAPTRDGAGQAQKNATAPVVDKAPETTKTRDAKPEEAEEEAAADANPQPEKPPTFVGQPFPTWSNGGKFSTFDSVPDIELGSAAIQTPVSGGKAKSTYLTILYGLIMSHVHMPPDHGGPHEGEIVFTVDGTGRLMQKQVARPSGLHALDSAALAAISEASPFPTPPQGMPMRLRFTYGAK